MISSVFSFSVALLALSVSIGTAALTIRQSNGANATSDCKIDSICFAIDQSGSIVYYEFYKDEKQFVINLSREIGKRTQGTQYSAVGFSNQAVPIQESTMLLETEFVPAVRDTSPVSGGTNMFAGLESCFSEVASSNGNRVIVLVTDGVDFGSKAPIDLAQDIKSEGISIVTIGIGNGIREEDLKEIATTGEFFVSTTFNTLQSDVLKITERSCDVVDVEPETPVPPSPEPVKDVCDQAYSVCEFYFANENSVPSFSMDGPDNVPFTPIVESRDMNERLGVLNSNDIMVEIIGDDESITGITSLAASQRFSPSQFKPFTWSNGKGSGIGHETFQGNQKEMVRGRCVRVFFSQFQLLQLSAPFNVVSNEVASRKDNKCLVFRTM